MSYGASHGVSEERRAQEGGPASTQESESRSARAARGEGVPGQSQPVHPSSYSWHRPLLTPRPLVWKAKDCR